MTDDIYNDDALAEFALGFGPGACEGELMHYTFTRDQLVRLLGGTIQMFVEYRDVHGKPEQDGADLAAVSEKLEGLDAERELADAGECKPTMQVYQPKEMNL